MSKKDISVAARRRIAAGLGARPGETFHSRCHWCDAPVSLWWNADSDRVHMGPETEMDHLHPEARGGRFEPGNVVLACSPCNRRKGSRTLWRGPLATQEIETLLSLLGEARDELRSNGLLTDDFERRIAHAALTSALRLKQVA